MNLTNSNQKKKINDNNSIKKKYLIDLQLEHHHNNLKEEKYKIQEDKLNEILKGEKDIVSQENVNTILKIDKVEKDDTNLNQIISIRKKGVMGLKNIGNTCFMNSSLQCLIHIKLLYENFKNVNNEGELCLALKEVLNNMYVKIRPPTSFEPKDIFRIMSSHFPKYKTKSQQGANEFINNFLLILHKELNSASYKEKSFNEISDEIIKKKFIKKQSYYQNNKSIIIDLFYGNTAVLYECKNGHIINAIFSIFNILELSIYQDKEKNEIKLEDLIKSYLSKNDAGYLEKCPKCNNTKEIYYKNKIIHTPDILIVYINKVIDNYYYNNKIIFPLKLDLTKEMDYDNKKKQIFDLIGIINHSGTENSGHYTANCKNFIDDYWYDFNDQIVNYIENLSNKSEKVMILFYKRNGL